jgi:hypothetical protein
MQVVVGETVKLREFPLGQIRGKLVRISYGWSAQAGINCCILLKNCGFLPSSMGAMPAPG